MSINKTIAFIFSSGLGTRLRPLTNNTPKSLLKIKDNLCLLDLNLLRLERVGIKKIFINYSYGKEIFEEVINKYANLDITLIEEKSPIGHGKTIFNNLNSLSSYEALLGINGDTYIDFDLEKYLKKYKNKNTILSDTTNSSKKSLLLDSNYELIGVNLIGRDYYYDSSDTVFSHKSNSVGLYTFVISDLKKIDIPEDDFIGLFGNADLYEELRKVFVKIIVVDGFEIRHYFSMNTLEELNDLKGQLSEIHDIMEIVCQ